MNRVACLLLGLVACRDAPSQLDRASAPGPSAASLAAGYCHNLNAYTTTAPLGTQQGSPTRPANTFSIVARDPATGDLAVEKQDMDAAVRHYSEATQLVPDAVEMYYWQGVTFAAKQDLTRAAPLLRKAFAQDPAWIELTRRLPAAGILPDAATAERAIAAAK